jgi:5-formyltetrahydrofolate cyclo-ligase
MIEKKKYFKAHYRNDAKKVLQSIDLFASSKAINDVLENCELLESAQNILYFWPFKDEINLLPSLKKSLEANKNCFLPKVISSNNSYAITRIESIHQELQKGFYGNYESNLEVSYQVNQIELIFVPGLMFDHLGYRLGRGLGFYDKLLAALNKSTISIGVTPKKLVARSLADIIDSWDKPVKYLLSEDGLKVI